MNRCKCTTRPGTTFRSRCQIGMLIKLPNAEPARIRNVAQGDRPSLWNEMLSTSKTTFQNRSASKTRTMSRTMLSEATPPVYGALIPSVVAHGAGRSASPGRLEAATAEALDEGPVLRRWAHGARRSACTQTATRRGAGARAAGRHL